MGKWYEEPNNNENKAKREQSKPKISDLYLVSAFLLFVAITLLWASFSITDAETGKSKKEDHEVGLLYLLIFNFVVLCYAGLTNWGLHKTYGGKYGEIRKMELLDGRKKNEDNIFNEELLTESLF